MESFNTQSSVLPFDIVILIIDTVGECKEIDLLKELALVSHSFLQICNKHLFATVELQDAILTRPSSKEGFVKLLKSRPHVVKYIRHLTYTVSSNAWFGRHAPVDEDQLLSPILPNFLKTIPHLKCLVISRALDWNTLDPSLTSALLHLMHLPTMNYINLSFIRNFPLSSLTPCVNLHRLDIFYMEIENGFPEIIQSEMPRIRQFYTSDSSRMTSNLLHAKARDGRPAFDFTDLKQLSVSFSHFEDEHNIRYLLQNAKLLEKLRLSTERDQLTLEGLHDILSPSARTLKTLELTIPLCHDDPPLAGLCEELEAMAGHNVLEALAFRIDIDSDETADFMGSRIQKMDEVLVKPGWSALKQVSFEILISCRLVSRETSAELIEASKSLPDKYLSHLSKLESVTLNCTVDLVKCGYCSNCTN